MTYDEKLLGTINSAAIKIERVRDCPRPFSAEHYSIDIPIAHVETLIEAAKKWLDHKKYFPQEIEESDSDKTHREKG